MHCLGSHLVEHLVKQMAQSSGKHWDHLLDQMLENCWDQHLA